MQRITDQASLKRMLNGVQQSREASFAVLLSPEISASFTDAGLRQLLVELLPTVQGVSSRIVRSRGRDTLLSAGLRYRDGVRLIDHVRGREGPPLSPALQETLQTAWEIVAEHAQGDTPEKIFRSLYDWVCRSIRYEHTAPGRKDYDTLVRASGVLKYRQGNCQGFADVLYLLCGLAGLEAEYRCGMGVRRLHVWNAVRLSGVWQEADASRGARQD